jgi:transposase-like protein
LIIDKSTRCYQCVSKFKLTTAIAQSNRPTLEQLEEDLRIYTYLDVGKKYGVSDNTIRSWIKQYKKHII